VLASAQITARLLARALRCARSPPGRRKTDAGPPRLRKTDGNGLLRRSRTVFAAADVFNLFSDEFSSYRAGSFAFVRRLARPLYGSFFRHVDSSIDIG
jgi:hypothetical protein